MTDVELRSMSRQRREELVMQLLTTRRQVEKDMVAARDDLRNAQERIDSLAARQADIEHSLGYLG